MLTHHDWAALLAHGGAGGLALELLPVVVIGALWLVVWRRSRRSAETASAPGRPRDEAGIEEQRR